MPERSCLVRAGDQDVDRGRADKRRQRQRQAQRRLGWRCRRDDPPRFLRQRERSRKERRRMAVVAETQQDQIERRPLPVKTAPQRALVVASRDVRVGKLGGHSVDIRRRTRHMIQQRRFRHSEIAARILGRNVTLVSPEHMHMRPRDHGWTRRREEAVQGSRRIPAS
jgi:hypothetical protein